MEESNSLNSTLDCLLKCVTFLDKCGESAVSLDGIVSGLQVARLLAQIIKIDEDDEEFWKVANADSNDEIPKYELNWRVIMPKLMKLFNSDEYDAVTLDLWQMNIPDIVRGDKDTIVRVLIYFVTGVLHGEGQSRLAMQEFLLELSEAEKTDIVDRMSTLYRLMHRPINGNDSSSSDEITKQYKARINEISQSKEKLLKENEELVLEITELRKQIEQGKKDAEEIVDLKSRLADSEMKIKYSENSVTSMKSDLFANQKLVQDYEFRIEKLQRQVDVHDSTLRNLQVENRDLKDECETMRSTEAQMQRKLKDFELNKKSWEREITASKQKEKEIEILKQRIEDLIKELTVRDSLLTKIASLEQMLSNEKIQRTEIGEDLTKALNRANDAEAQIISLQQQVRREQSSRADDLTNSFTSNLCVSLQDELSNSNSSFLQSDFDMGLKDVAEWKAKCETLEAKNNRLLSELHNTQALNENTHSDYTTQIEKERNQAEKMGLERIGLMKRVFHLEHTIASLNDENKSLKEEKSKLDTTIHYQEKCLQKSADVIRVYSDGQDSSAENLKLRAETERLQKELDSLKLKVDQFKHESCQEQRLITSQWYQWILPDFRRKTIASNSIANSSLNNVEKTNKCGELIQTRRKTFIERQLETSEFTASSSSRDKDQYDDKTIFAWKNLLTYVLGLLTLLVIGTMLKYEFCVYTNLTKSTTCTLLGRMPELKTDHVYYLTNGKL